ncbi:MAG TPA: DUF1778 domain-containing protein [Acidisphaera sp.]|nr:DUF1778 domain-containing protein [Acidisphaera sp.]
MAFTKDRESKVERLEVRLTPSTKSLLSQAAQIRHTTLTEFLVSSAVRAAEEALVSARVFEISTDDGWNMLMDLLDNTSNDEPDEELVALLNLSRRKE